MKSASSSLAALHELLDLRLEQARLALAGARRAADRRARTVQAIGQLRQAHAGESAERFAQAPDPVRHRSALEHLARLSRQQEAAEVDLASARAVLANASESGLAADRRRAVLERMMQRERDLRAAAAVQAQAREADQQWLVRQAARSARRAREGDAA